jgi:hypothetical protein
MKYLKVFIFKNMIASLILMLGTDRGSVAGETAWRSFVTAGCDIRSVKALGPKNKVLFFFVGYLVGGWASWFVGWLAGWLVVWFGD